MNFKDYSEFDVASALYHFLQHNWDGQSDPMYEAFCTLTQPGMFSPGAAESFYNIDDAAMDVYGQLTRDNYAAALKYVLSYESES